MSCIPPIAKIAGKTRSKALAYAPSSLSCDDIALWIRVVDRQNASRGQCGAQIIHQEDSREREQHVTLGLGNVVSKTNVPDPPRTVVRTIIDRSKHPRSNDAVENMARDDGPCAGEVKDPLNAEVRRHVGGMGCGLTARAYAAAPRPAGRTIDQGIHRRCIRAHKRNSTSWGPRRQLQTLARRQSSRFSD
jgi:hypothetical protein